MLMSLSCLFFTRCFRQPLNTASGEFVNKKNSVRPKQLGNWFLTLSVVRAEQTNENGKFAFLSFA